MNESWKNDPKLQSVDRTKLDMLQKLAEQGMGKSPSDLMSYLMQLKSGSKNSGLKFQPGEIAAIIEVLKIGKSPEECARLDRMIQLMSLIK